jgi:hypothetical protein
MSPSSGSILVGKATDSARIEQLVLASATGTGRSPALPARAGP